MKRYLSLVKFSHTIFAMPFALLGFFLGSMRYQTDFSWKLLLLVILCMVFARNAAMAFNRFLDRQIDAQNPRTAVREVPAGIINPRSALIFVIVNTLLFIATTWFINPLCFFLSPVVIIITLGYSYTKRFTALCHFVLGLGLAIAPLGGYLAAGGTFDLLPLLYALAVLFWVAGFDVIYALQDADFDKNHGLHSVPSRIGPVDALRLSTSVHLLCAGLILWAGFILQDVYPETGVLSWIAACAFLILLTYQHFIVKPTDLRRVNLAFFTTNGLASLLFGTLIILDLLV